MHPLPRGNSTIGPPLHECELCKKERSPALDRTACNCLALRQAARHVSQLYDSYLASEGLRTTQFSILAKLDRLGQLSIHYLGNCNVMGLASLCRRECPILR